jgi:hypothetical protein
MDIEQFYIEKRDNFVCFISELRAEWPDRLHGLDPKGPDPKGLGSSSQGCYSISPDLDFASFQGYKILLRAAIASGTVDGYVEKFLVEDGIDVKGLPAERLAKIKRYLEMFSEL